VQNREEVIVIFVDLCSLITTENVFVCERVELESLLQPGSIGGTRALNVDPTEAFELDLIYMKALRLLGRDNWTADAACTTESGLRKTRHPDLEAPRP
jgi:hypothetical protein